MQSISSQAFKVAWHRSSSTTSAASHAVRRKLTRPALPHRSIDSYSGYICARCFGLSAKRAREVVEDGGSASTEPHLVVGMSGTPPKDDPQNETENNTGDSILSSDSAKEPPPFWVQGAEQATGEGSKNAGDIKGERVSGASPLPPPYARQSRRGRARSFGPRARRLLAAHQDNVDNTEAAAPPKNPQEKRAHSKSTKRPRPSLPYWFVQAAYAIQDAGGPLPRAPTPVSAAKADPTAPEYTLKDKVFYQSKDGSWQLPPNSADDPYSLHEKIYDELVVLGRAALSQSNWKVSSNASKDMGGDIYHLFYPKRGGTYFLDALVSRLASSLGESWSSDAPAQPVDIIRLDPLLLSRLFSEHISAYHNFSDPSEGLHSAESYADLSHNIYSLPENDEQSASMHIGLSSSSEPHGSQGNEAQDEEYEDKEQYDSEGEGEEYESRSTNFQDSRFPRSGQNNLSGRWISGKDAVRYFSPHFSASMRKILDNQGIGILLNTTPFSPGSGPGSKRDTPWEQMSSNGSVGDDGFNVPEEAIVKALLRAILDGSPLRIARRKRQSTAGPHAANTIIHIKDFGRLSDTLTGHSLVNILKQLVRERRRRTGENYLIVGTSSGSFGTTDGITTEDIAHMQSFSDNEQERVVVIPPIPQGAGAADLSPESGLPVWEKEQRIWRNADLRRRHSEINSWHLTQWFTSRGISCKLEPEAPLLDSENTENAESAPRIDGRILSKDHVERIGLATLGGLLGPRSEVADHDRARVVMMKDITLGIQTLESSDTIKKHWTAYEKFLQNSHDGTEAVEGLSDSNFSAAVVLDDDPSFPKVGPGSSLEPPRTKGKNQKQYNTHEQRLLGGVINPETLRGGFDLVQAPDSTIEALKILTSLSLVRADAFSYGVLATDRIGGALLYGPPGTGKTLLARAVAKESGATVLEVSGSEVYDMYVGESEKNVKAIFTLAGKLAPCVVFIDEADAMFCARTTNSNRTAHRELINQFLKEMDGISPRSSKPAFFMLATNRPFDLDDAVLRRLPRRILVDLPTEKDREAILKLNLKDEILAPDVDLPAIAKGTNLYSGSDLKNVCVAAALACVKEENKAFQDAKAARAARIAIREAAKETAAEAELSELASTEAHPEAQPVAEEEAEVSYPPKRILTAAHFRKALDEIAASISEDMSSLTAIRKFDEKYGEAAAKRRKKAAWGFSTAALDAAEGMGTGRVRKD